MWRDVGGEDRQPHRHPLDDDSREAFEEARRHQEIGCRHEIGKILPVPQEAHPIRDAEALGLPVQIGGRRGLPPRDQQEWWLRQIAELRERLEQVALTLLMIEPPGAEHDRLVLVEG